MHDRRMVRGPVLRGLRSGGLLVISGAALFVWLFSGVAPIIGPVPELVPMALAVSLLICGGYMMTRPRAAGVAKSDRTRSAIGYFQSARDPVFITRLDGTLQAQNDAAGPIQTDTPFLAPWSEDAAALQYRLTSAARQDGVASEFADPEMKRRISAIRSSPDALVWRIEAASAAAGSPSYFAAGIPWVRINEDCDVVAANAAARGASGPPVRIGDLLEDLPFRPGGVHIHRETGRPVRALVVAEHAGVRDLLLYQLDGDEIAGLVPEHFLEELPVALARLEPNGVLTYANRSARQLLGDRAEPGVNITELIEGLGRSITERLVDTTKGRALGRSEVARGSLDGAEIFLQVAFTRTVRDGSQSLFAVLSDATELKTLEAQFVQSQKMQAVGQLAGGVAHDFNNLLTAINGHCDLLLMRHDVVDAEHGDLMQIRQNANRAAALVRQLLAFSRKQTLRPKVINLQDTLSELTHLLNRLLTDKVTLRIANGADVAPVRVDERQFEQVIMNLVVNARDAMPHGGEVRIATRNVRLEKDLHRDRAVILRGDYVLIEVVDSGTGIPENKLNKIFEPFYTTKQVGEGTGLGLSTAYGIIKQTGGFIFASSPPGQGATFSIYLPAYDKIEMPEIVEAEPRRALDLTGRGMVLLVEDEGAVRSIASRALRLRGYTVLEAASGEEALEILKDGGLHVDLMLSDVIMPGLDGPGWVREAKRTRPSTKVMFMSGYAEDAFVGGDSGIADAAFLPKPFTLNELTQRVKDYLDA